MEYITSLTIDDVEYLSLILSHGWTFLKPFVLLNEPPSLLIPYNVHPNKGILIIQPAKGLKPTKINKVEPAIAKEIASICLSLDVHTNELYEIASLNKLWSWIVDLKKGRFIRSPTLFEDSCKAIFATNTTWKRTIEMAELMVSFYGEPVDHIKAFPTPDVILNMPEQEIRAKTKCGFRARYIKDLALKACSDREFYLYGGWKDVSDVKFANNLKTVLGLGPVSIGYISRLYGKVHGYAIDSYVIRRSREIWNNSTLTIIDIENLANNRYKDFGKFASSVFWFELTKKWHSKSDILINDHNYEDL